MAAENELQVHADEADLAWRAIDAAVAEVQRIEAKYSRYRPDSVVSHINAAAGGRAIAIDPETQGLLAYADACFHQSEGLFDATSGVLRRVWRFDERRVPDDVELEMLRPLIGWDKVELGPGSVRLPMRAMELDFGGFGKEYAVDRAAHVLASHGIASAMVNLAGDIAILGPQPGGAPWQVGIRHPRRAGALVATVPVSAGAVATSGDYERFIEVEGVRHCHVLDPRTGRSARGLQSVSVHAASCLVAGSATTIAMLKGRAGIDWLREIGVPFIAVRDDASVVNHWPRSGA